MAKEIGVLGNSNFDPREVYAFSAWEPTEGRPVDPKLVKSIGGVNFAPSQILRKPFNNTPNLGSSLSVSDESGHQSGNPIPNL